MSKFDLVFEKAMLSLKENVHAEANFKDNLSGLLKALQDKGYLEQDQQSIEKIIRNNEILDPNNFNRAEFQLKTSDRSIPAIKIRAVQIQPTKLDPGKFSVTVFNQETKESKDFQNTVEETIIADVLDYIKIIVLNGLGLKPEAAVDELPPAEGAQAQPGAEESALPKV